jgi:hypothetical protein
VEFKTIFSDFLAVVQGLTLVASLVFLFFVYRLTERERKQRLSNTQSDLTNMMILFQTMRDMLRQQKDLAHQLNESLDKKVVLIRTTVDAALKDLDGLRENVRVISQTLARTAEELTSIQKQVAYAQDEHAGAANARRPEPVIPEEPTPRAGALESPTLHVFAPPSPQRSGDDVIDNWVGLDFGAAVSEDVSPEVHVPSHPSDAEAARQAFRALLNLDDTAREEEENAGPEPFAPVPSPASGNGKGKTGPTPIQGRVYEYSDAGMTIPQISRELGIGKGEVRLILSLRSDKER